MGIKLFKSNEDKMVEGMLYGLTPEGPAVMTAIEDLFSGISADLRMIQYQQNAYSTPPLNELILLKAGLALPSLPAVASVRRRSIAPAPLPGRPAGTWRSVIPARPAPAFPVAQAENMTHINNETNFFIPVSQLILFEHTCFFLFFICLRLKMSPKAILSFT